MRTTSDRKKRKRKYEQDNIEHKMFLEKKQQQRKNNRTKENINQLKPNQNTNIKQRKQIKREKKKSMKGGLFLRNYDKNLKYKAKIIQASKCQIGVTLFLYNIQC